ncbi:unnamed protein product [Paramecium sonneborni]|uniref:Uncharacterized protein n=1 Tax=Paramecium sonneborni TaxID=65129 RepID=A0A8S1R4J0_9CILI|nr:unnamed protein product [Paramecium sonneborni]
MDNLNLLIVTFNQQLSAFRIFRSLSIHQTWAQLVVEVFKRIESRIWGTNYKGSYLENVSAFPASNHIFKLDDDVLKISIKQFGKSIAEQKYFMRFDQSHFSSSYFLARNILNIFFQTQQLNEAKRSYYFAWLKSLFISMLTISIFQCLFEL